jgi:hypothetical protein
MPGGVILRSAGIVTARMMRTSGALHTRQIGETGERRHDQHRGEPDRRQGAKYTHRHPRSR